MRRPPQSKPFEIPAERCWSGRTGLPAKQLSRQNRDRGFESPPLRHSTFPLIKRMDLRLATSVLLYLEHLEAAMAISEERANREAARALRRHWKNFGKAPAPAAPPRAKPQSLSSPEERGFFQKVSIYTREKNKVGKWRYRGVRT